MRTLILFSLAIPLIVQSQEPNKIERGWSKIDFIYPVMLKNPIISHEDAYRIVESIGYKTLPNSITFDTATYLKRHGLPAIVGYKLLDKPYLFIDITYGEIGSGKYYGYLDISLREDAASRIIQTSYMHNGVPDSVWMGFPASIDLISRGMVFMNYDSNDVQEAIREKTQEFFEELSIKVREQP